MNFTERKSRFLNGTTFSDLGTFTLLNTLKVSLGKGPFLLAQTAQLQILILGHMGFTRLVSHDYFSSYGVTSLTLFLTLFRDLSGF